MARLTEAKKEELYDLYEALYSREGVANGEDKALILRIKQFAEENKLTQKQLNWYSQEGLDRVQWVQEDNWRYYNNQMEACY